jgi:hypothetical protein
MLSNDSRLGCEWCGSAFQGILRADCNPRSRTNYYTIVIALFTLPVDIVLYIGGIRFLLWGLRPALLYVRPQLKGHAFFDHSIHTRTNALCLDVRRPWRHHPTALGALARMYFKAVRVTGDDWAY